MDDSEDENDDITQMVKYRKLETENDKLKLDMKSLVGECKKLKNQLKSATKKMVNIAACGKQGKSSKAETNLKAAKKGM
jgi:ribosomal protein L12E/L44/L45/RPP1/RPP2